MCSGIRARAYASAAAAAPSMLPMPPMSPGPTRPVACLGCIPGSTELRKETGVTAACPLSLWLDKTTIMHSRSADHATC